MIAAIVLLGCGEPTPRDHFEAAFPDAYCAWLDTCPDSDAAGTGLADCVGFYTDAMAAEHGIPHVLRGTLRGAVSREPRCELTALPVV